MKKALSILLAVVMVACALPFSLTASAETTSGTTGSCTWTLDGTVLTVSGNGNMGDYYAYYTSAPWGKSVTEVIIEEGVKSVGERTFFECAELINITIPNSVTSIGGEAFSGCTGLMSITIGESVTSIGEFAFSDCTELIKVNTTDLSAWCNIEFGNDYSNPTYYSKSLYVNGKSVKELIIPDGVTSIKTRAFFNCATITSVEIPNSVTSIGSEAFSGCTGITSVTIPDSVISIDAWAFVDCKKITSITIPKSVTGIGGGAFENCIGLKSVTIPSSVTWCGYGAFEGCYYIENVYIDDLSAWLNIEFYDDVSNPLYYADNLYVNGVLATDVTIPKELTTIKSKTFAYFRNMTNLIIPKSVTSIANNAFYKCDNITDVWYEGSEEDRDNMLIGSTNSNILNATWHYNYKPATEIKYGLVTENEEISASDALAILQASVGKIEFTDTQKTAGDVDGDGEITASDALIVLQFSVGKITIFPVEQ